MIAEYMEFVRYPADTDMLDIQFERIVTTEGHVYYRWSYGLDRNWEKYVGSSYGYPITIFRRDWQLCSRSCLELKKALRWAGYKITANGYSNGRYMIQFHNPIG